MARLFPSVISKLGKTAILVLLVSLFTLSCLYFAPRWNPIPPRQMVYLLEADDVSRGMVTSATRITGRVSRPICPHHLEFVSTNGPVNIFVVPFELAGGRDEIDRMLATTEALRQGRPPTDAIAQANAPAGKFVLHRWPYGNVQYVVYLRSEAATEVTLKVHYAP